MKKFAKILITLILAVLACLALVACDEVEFEIKDGFKNSTTESSAVQGGFVAEVNGFYYVINGVGDSLSDNTYGVPVSGSLIAIKKDEPTKGAVVVPKLLVSTDYNAGVYIIGGYAYFATPSTDKNLEGDVKNSNMVFARQKLDGTNYKEFITVDSLSTEFRFVETDNGVEIVYYDYTDSAIYSYNTNTGAKNSIIKKDETKNESLENYVFFDNKDLSKGVVAYTTTLYSGKYVEGTTRNALSYNNLYVYKAGNKNSISIKKGDDNELKDQKITINKIVNGEVVYKISTTLFTDKLYKGTTLIAENTDKYDSTFIETAENFYKFDSEKGAITEDGEVFAYTDSVSTLLFKDGDFIYYINSSSYLARIEKGAETLPEILSDSSASTSWYDIVKIGDYVFYADSSSVPKYLFIDESNKIEDEKDGETTGYHYENQFTISDSLTDYDQNVKNVIKEINKLSDTLDKNGRIVLDNEGKIPAVKTARTHYDALSNAQKEKITNYDVLCEYEDAIYLSVKCKTLKDVDLKVKDKIDKDDYKVDYDNATTRFKAVEKKGQTYLTKVCNLMEGNTYYWYNYAKTNIFNK